MRRFLSLLLMGGFMLVAMAVFAPPLRAAANHPAEIVAWTALMVASPIATLLFIMGSTALTVLLTVVKTERIQREASVVNTHRSACFWWGLPTSILVLLLSRTGLGVVVVPLASLALAVGFAGVSLAVGRRLLNKTHSYPLPVVAAVGAVVLGFAFLVPFAGWVLFLYVACLSLGAFRLTWFGGLAGQMFFPDDVN